MTQNGTDHNPSSLRFGQEEVAELNLGRRDGEGGF